ncbi:MAG: ABC transporter ATP-binding protein [Erysipelotrichaceae bacterium]|nr:ABC transporter ATP-binding protein [Erysipelotrichaceae bacterium]
MIEIQNLTKTFGSTRAVDGLTLTFRPGITGLVGHNGAGKSTLFRTIAGIYPANGGSVLIDGCDATSQEGKAKVFFLSDDPLAPKGVSLAGVLEFYGCLFDVDEERFYRIVKTFGLPMDKPINTFSKGMRRQVFVALALAMKADHLLLDEAFDGLDPLVVDAIKGEIIAAAEEGKTIVISSHNIFALQRLVDRFVILHKGKVTKEGSSEDIGTEFVKFQAAFKFPVVEENISSLGFNVVSFRVVGSVTHFVILGKTDAEEIIKEKMEPLFIERVALDPDEILALEMALAKKEGDEKNA